MRRNAVIVIFIVAAGLASGSFVFAHLDYRERETHYVNLRLGLETIEPSGRHLGPAIALGIPAAMAGACAVALTVFELPIFRRPPGPPADSGSEHS